jgi:formyltetrahydrofolate hydrolase
MPIGTSSRYVAGLLDDGPIIEQAAARGTQAFEPARGI